MMHDSTEHNREDRLIEELLKGKYATIEPRPGLRNEILADIDQMHVRGSSSVFHSLLGQMSGWYWMSAVASFILITSVALQHDFFQPSIPTPPPSYFPVYIDGKPITSSAASDEPFTSSVSSETSSAEEISSQSASSASSIRSIDASSSSSSSIPPVRSSSLRSLHVTNEETSANTAVSSALMLPVIRESSMSSSSEKTIVTPPVPAVSAVSSASISGMKSTTQDSASLQASSVEEVPLQEASPKPAVMELMQQSFTMPLPASSSVMNSVGLVVRDVQPFALHQESSITLLITNGGPDTLILSLPFSWGDGMSGTIADITLKPGESRAITLPHTYVQSGLYEFSAFIRLASDTFMLGEVRLFIWAGPY